MINTGNGEGGGRPPSHRHAGYGISPRCRKRVEEVFDWIKASTGLAKIKSRCRSRVDAASTSAPTTCNLVRSPKLSATPR